MNATSNNSHTCPEPPASTTHFHHDWDGDRSLAAAIVSAVADCSRKPPTELEVLYEVVDPDALDELFEPRSDDARRNGGHLWFQLDECAVTVSGDGFVTVRRLE
ncbi:HalOD1 output domain-containing protein [Natronobeatus ordinarius]|uniref:HalOD1 output domain-containing protein n=1 Tax=Natronobeatus ordinarius TaxID=2963433 RepID=UPI0020CD7F8E|nr:HalOD1 output domain-containing protein [Natronobeatus ordinarius]